MNRCCTAGAALVLMLAVATARAQGAAVAPPARAASGTLTGYFTMLPDQPNYGTAIGSVDVGSLHFEGRYNYEARASASAFVGWTFAGGQEITWEVTPIAGLLSGRARGWIPGVEASLGWRSFDAYVEAEVVLDRDDSDDNYFYAWSELGWRPVEWLRIGLVGQRTRIVNNDRDLQRGVLLQLFAGRATFSAYAFNPDNARRYTTIAVGIDF